MWQLTARRCCHRIVAPSPTSSPAGPKRSADSSGAAITAAPCCTSSTLAATAPARSVTPSRREASGAFAGFKYLFPVIAPGLLCQPVERGDDVLLWNAVLEED